MIFYIIPPRALIELSKFNECCLARFTYFVEVAKTQNYETIAKKFIVDSKLDEIGHFILKCFCAYKPEVEDYIVAREKDLFLHRLETIPWEEKHKVCRSTVEQVRRVQHLKLYDPVRRNKEIPRLAKFLWPTLTELCETLSIPEIGDHMSKQCDSNCKKFVQKVPFQVCPSLVRNRSVVIEKGFAIVPCSTWYSLLAELFTHHYKLGLLMISSTILSSLKSDSRWTSAFAELSTLYDSRSKNGLISRKHLTAKQIDREKRYFPPCMRHLLTILRTNHRLSHNWRYRLSLFLKDIGLDVDESIEFWKNEYSKSCTPESSCTHSWQINHKKYLYSIRHLYGLVGFHQNGYNKPKSCHAYQGMKLNMREEGGCPFVHFDDTNLLASFSAEIRDDSDITNKIFEQKTLENPIQACYVYQEACAKKYKLQIPYGEFESPVEYYNCMKQCSNTTLEW